MDENSDTSDRLLRGLEKPAAYPEAVKDVEHLQTHISHVFLAGDFAYKLKKPVNLGFVDFSTLERREFFCQEELRLNRRLAESLYLDVVPVVGTQEQPRIGKPGEGQIGSNPPLEFAVKMRRFPHQAELVQVLADQKLTRDHIDDLARTVANFHANVAVAPPATPWGTPTEVMRPVRENFRHLKSSADEHQAVIVAVEEWSEHEFKLRHDEFIRRKQAGFIRECHGDMHLGNMLLENDRVVIFDCIEFNEGLRWIDVQSEIAFLAMDLEDRQQPEFAHRVLNAYLEITGDYEGASLLPFYQTYRAVVRAKVAHLRAEQTTSAEAQSGTGSSMSRVFEQCRREVDTYLELARRYITTQSPTLFVTHGLSGSGKTHYTQTVVEETGALRLRSDVERKRLAGLDAHTSSKSAIGAGLYSPELNRRTYERLRDLATHLLQAGRSVIIDATNLRREQRHIFREIAQRLAVRHMILEFTAPASLLRERVQQRQQTGTDASEATLAVLENQLKEIEPLDEVERLDTVSIDTSAPNSATKMREQLKSRLSR